MLSVKPRQISEAQLARDLCGRYGRHPAHVTQHQLSGLRRRWPETAARYEAALRRARLWADYRQWRAMRDTIATAEWLEGEG